MPRAVGAQDRPHPRAVRFEEGLGAVVQGLNSGDRHLAGAEPRRDEEAEAVEDGLDVDLADAFQRVRQVLHICAVDSPRTARPLLPRRGLATEESAGGGA